MYHYELRYQYSCTTSSKIINERVLYVYGDMAEECLITPHQPLLLRDLPHTNNMPVPVATPDINTRWFGPEADAEFGALRAVIDEKQEQGWDEAWSVHVSSSSFFVRWPAIWCRAETWLGHLYRKGNVTPWDAGKPQPALTGLIKSGQVEFPRTGRALVPGCGRVTPRCLRCMLPPKLTMSTSGIRRRRYRDHPRPRHAGDGRLFLCCRRSPKVSRECRLPFPELTRDVGSYLEAAGVPDAKVQFDVVDFFASEEVAVYDLIYDYTCVHSRLRAHTHTAKGR